MNGLLKTNKITMSSLEISELTGKRHDNIIRDIEKMLDGLEISPLKFEGVYKDQKGEERKSYNLPKRECLVLVSGYSIKLRAAIIDRWQELEATFSIPKNYAEALELAAKQAREIDVLAPKAALADKAIRDESKHYSITDAGKHLGLRQSEIFAIMRSKGLLNSKNLPTQKALDYGVLQERTNPCAGGKNRPQAILTMENIHEFNRRYCRKGVTPEPLGCGVVRHPKDSSPGKQASKGA